MRRWFGRTKARAQPSDRAANPRRFQRLPERVDVRKTRTGRAVSPARDPEGGRDTDRDFITRYGDPFDDA
jgi:hypothetical protein